MLLFESQSLCDTQNCVQQHGDLSWDPFDTWKFLNQTLFESRQKGESVWLGFHFGPDAGESSLNYNVRLTELMDVYQVFNRFFLKILFAINRFHLR